MAVVNSIFRPGLFQGKVAIVTGGSTGIGIKIVQELLNLGAKVVIASRNEERIRRVADDIMNDGGGEVKALPCNIRDETQVKDLMEKTLSCYGKLDFLVNNGGGQFMSAVAQMKTKGWKAVIDTNLNGTFNCCKQAYHIWMKDNGGVIVNIIADMWNGLPGIAHTGAARAAVENLSKSLAIEWASNGIRINCVAPGAVYSETAAANYKDYVPDLFDQAIRHIPARRCGTPEEVSAAVCFLLSPAASFINGSSIKVDGASSIYSTMWDVPDGRMRPFLRGNTPLEKDELMGVIGELTRVKRFLQQMCRFSVLLTHPLFGNDQQYENVVVKPSNPDWKSTAPPQTRNQPEKTAKKASPKLSPKPNIDLVQSTVAVKPGIPSPKPVTTRSCGHRSGVKALEKVKALNALQRAKVLQSDDPRQKDQQLDEELEKKFFNDIVLLGKEVKGVVDGSSSTNELLATDSILGKRKRKLLCIL